ncbi:NAD(P)-dependent alcohol dehydrogenase [Meridianimarinicoccus roseus]|uniref:NAD(P)-dependent alcohol dehydrogenase n=1 Tax=Meridianimarinicoccus roseus TaxID=2072018 RepID=A0A2V2LEA1_9RHOB|nr:NAD(P)-dependent alcohol dehydrogenase [Meridianimarinicoccus roseus]PWR01557.1 NAD(P)-dependent alcohol dehydrogenase [Meridianimarinicoccus roseus]
MKAALYRRYGPASVVTVGEMPTPEAGPNDVLIAVEASAVTTADWRFRASAFPGGMWLLGRLMAGLRGPRQPVLGRDFAGRIVAVGEEVTQWRVGQRVFGVSPGMGAHAEMLALPESAPMVELPDGADPAEAAALPFGAMSALSFLRDIAALQPGERVLITGASGGVGAYAVQIARHLGAEVTAAAGPGRAALLHGLGAARVADYTAGPVARRGDGYDVILDTVGSLGFAQARGALAPRGRFVPLEFSLGDVGRALAARLRGGQRMLLGIAPDRREDLIAVADLWQAGALRPVIDARMPLAQIADAHARVEGRHKTGSLVIEIAGTAPTAAPAAA